MTKQLELYLSTDGKHTIRVYAEDEAEFDKLVAKAKGIYKNIVEEFGMKGQKKAEKPKATEKEHTHVVEFKIAGEKAKYPGRKYKICKGCGKFLGWVK